MKDTKFVSITSQVIAGTILFIALAVVIGVAYRFVLAPLFGL